MLTAILINAIMAMAQETIEPKASMDDAALKARILNLIGDSDFDPEYIPKFAERNGVSSEQMTTVVEDIVREGIVFRNTTGIHTNSQRRMEYVASPHYRLGNPMCLLRFFHGTNTVAILQESILGGKEYASSGAIMVYVEIAGAESLPFFREIISTGRLDEYERRIVYGCLDFNLGGWRTNREEAPQRAVEKGSGDAGKYRAFLKDMAQTEPNVDNIRQLDKILCARFEDYKDSPARTNALERIRQLDPTDGQPRIISIPK